MEQQKGDLRVWWVRNPPHDPEYFPVASVREGADQFDRLAAIDLSLPDHVLFANAGGMEVWDGEEWVEWGDDDWMDLQCFMTARDIVRQKVRNGKQETLRGEFLCVGDEVVLWPGVRKILEFGPYTGSAFETHKTWNVITCDLKNREQHKYLIQDDHSYKVHRLRKD